jgi:predicted nucleic acid-binding protein
VRRQRISFDFRLVEQDPDDDKFVNAYVAGQADYLVTDDRHFRVMLASKFPTVRVVSAAEFMEVLTEKL